MQGIYVSEDDFPITIRNYNNEDKVKLKEGVNKICQYKIIFN